MKKYLVIAFMLLIFAVSAYAYDLNSCRDGNSLADVGECIQIGVFGDTFFFALIMILMLAIFMWQTRIPMGASIGIFLIMLFMLSPYLTGTYDMLFNLSLVTIGALVGLALLHFIRK